MDLDGPPPVVLQLFSLWRYKEWGEEKYVQVIRAIVANWRLPVLVSGASHERERVRAIVHEAGLGVFNLAGKTTIGQYAALLSRCQLFIGVDIAGQHIAAAVGVPTVFLYGSSNPRYWAPCGHEHRVVSKQGFSCMPCRRVGCKDSHASRCLDELGVDEVLPSIADSLQPMDK